MHSDSDDSEEIAPLPEPARRNAAASSAADVDDEDNVEPPPEKERERTLSPPPSGWTFTSNRSSVAMSGALRPRRLKQFRTSLADHRRVLPRSAPAGQWLYPFSSVGGPNNQYLQLILAALAAKASGRTLLLAPFVKWGHNPGTFAKNFSSTFDAGALARFVPVRSLAAPRAFSFSAVSQVVTAGGAPSTDNFRILCYAAGLLCNGDALRASATGFGSEALARCKGTVKSDGSYMRCLLSKWADRSTLGFSAWGFGKVKVRAPLHEGGRRTAAPA